MRQRFVDGFPDRAAGLGALVRGLAAAPDTSPNPLHVVTHRLAGLAGLPTLLVDPDRIEQAIVNVLSNALKFAPSGSVVEVDATCDGQAVRLAIRDHGPGIRPEDIPRLFGKFRQLDASPTRKTSGTGLGLVITKSLVESHGGRIEEESQFGQGSTFTIVLPTERSQGRGT